MKQGKPNIKWVLLTFLAIAIWFWWAFGFSSIYYQLYLVVGAPEQPTTLMWWLIPGLSFVMAFVPAIALRWFSPKRTIKELSIFSIFLFVLPAITTLITGGMQSFTEILASVGFWGYVAGGVSGGGVSIYVG